MQKNVSKLQQTISTALDAAFQRALKQEQAEDPVVIDIRSAKYVIFSDLHKGNRNAADDFQICERAYNAALAYYDRLQYTLIELGDVEELWEEWPDRVIKAYEHTLELEGKFHREGRYRRLWGNHDDTWSHPDLVEKWLKPALKGGPLKVHEALILHVRDGEEELGKLFLVHGHQGTFDSEKIASLSRLTVRYFWRPIQRIFKIRLNTPSRDFELRHDHDHAMYSWSFKQDKVVLIAGHTHRPVFKSESHEEATRTALKKAEEKYLQQPDNVKLKQEIAKLAAEVEWVLAQNRLASKDLPVIELQKPSYFNTGCCAFLDGDVTGLEISEGEIRLVRWPDDDSNPKPKVLALAKLKDVFEAC